MPSRMTNTMFVVDDPEADDRVRVEGQLQRDGRWKVQLRCGIAIVDTTKTWDIRRVAEVWANRALALGIQARALQDQTDDQLRRLARSLDQPVDLDQEPADG